MKQVDRELTTCGLCRRDVTAFTIQVLYAEVT